MSDEILIYEKDAAAHIARITFNRPDKKNALTTAMYPLLIDALDDAADDDDIKVVILRGAGGVFTTGQDMGEAYSWYEKPAAGERPRRPSQRRRLAYDRKAQRAYHALYQHNKVIVAQVEKYALGGGLEFALAADLTVVGHDALIGMPAARFLGPVLGNLHLFFFRLGPALAKDLLLTGRIAEARDAAERGVWNRFVPGEEVAAVTEELAALVARMPADGLVIAKEAYRVVQNTPGLGAAEGFEILTHAFGTNLRFEDDEYNFVKIRSKVGVKKAFELRDRYFDGGEPIACLLYTSPSPRDQ
ncbi:MAG: enoyl-CoA hydratase/isomerase family protein, partial [Acidimicrobiales bacterium]|nr:enoyl-CoA hydratase/isomerase family protein [Acidimicrobiales bacterium]